MSDTKEQGKHTPGPWGYFHDTCAKCREEGVSEYEVPEIPQGYHARFTNEADARLIAAAPELLRLAIDIRDWYENAGNADPTQDSIGSVDLWQRAKAAIAKAEGRDQP